jgi:hypothetical protein
MACVSREEEVEGAVKGRDVNQWHGHPARVGRRMMRDGNFKFENDLGHGQDAHATVP